MTSILVKNSKKSTFFFFIFYSLFSLVSCFCFSLSYLGLLACSLGSFCWDSHFWFFGSEKIKGKITCLFLFFWLLRLNGWNFISNSPWDWWISLFFEYWEDLFFLGICSGRSWFRIQLSLWSPNPLNRLDLLSFLFRVFFALSFLLFVFV